MALPDDFPTATVLGLDGEAVRVDGFWREGPAVLIFLRHFG